VWVEQRDVIATDAIIARRLAATAAGIERYLESLTRILPSEVITIVTQFLPQAAMECIEYGWWRSLPDKVRFREHNGLGSVEVAPEFMSVFTNQRYAMAQQEHVIEYNRCH